MNTDYDLQQQTNNIFDSCTAERIENSLCTAWAMPTNPSILLGLVWAYRDCGFEYASGEAAFLWNLALEMQGK